MEELGKYAPLHAHEIAECRQTRTLPQVGFAEAIPDPVWASADGIRRRSWLHRSARECIADCSIEYQPGRVDGGATSSMKWCLGHLS